jgi:hypothetical protein
MIVAKILVYADDVNVLVGGVNTAKKNRISLAATIKENGLEINAEKTKDMLVSRDQNAG